MILELHVENLAIIERAEIALGPGFSVLTGETGAGKSLLVDAIELAFGSRADSELVRAGAPRATVRAVLELSGSPALTGLCDELGIALEEGLLYIHREVFAEGRSQCRVAGKLTPVSALRRLGAALVDLHGQHDHQALLDSETHIQFLDEWIGDPALEFRAQVARAYAEVSDLRTKLASLRAGMREREHRLDLLRYQINEIEAFDLQQDELEHLESQLSRLRNVEKLELASSSATELLWEGEANAGDLLRAALKQLEDASRVDPSLENPLTPLRDALASLEDGVAAVRAYAETLDSDPERLEATAERLDGIKRLFRKYGENEAAVLAFLDEARRELALLEQGGQSEEEVASALEQCEEQLGMLAQRLTGIRQMGAQEFAALVQDQLRQLAMERAEFAVSINPKEIDVLGADRVEFYFTANAGEPPRPLSKIASGGEISRVMLAIKTATAGKAGVPTLIFDEVDAGLGGRAAAVVGKKLEELATHYQVIVISHLPQIASRATSHYRIEKAERNGRVVTDVRRLSQDERVEEIARMLAGAEVGDTALVHAREMLARPG
jgi:DNA repair protein RecN (Recombination protein N)